MIQITEQLAVTEECIELSFIRASGPGGQNVNKVATAVQLRFDTQRAASLPDDVRARALRLAGRKATREGTIIIEASRYRTQQRNREDAMERLGKLLSRAATAPRIRKKRRVSIAKKKKRVAQKRTVGEKKSLRRPPPNE